MTADRNTDHDLPLGGPDTDPDIPAPSAALIGSRVESRDRSTKPGEAAPPPHRLSQTAKSELSPFHTDPSLATGDPANISTTQESESVPADEVDRHYFLERRILVVEEENAQLSARLRLAEKGVEDARRLSMAASIFALGAMLVAKLLAG